MACEQVQALGMALSSWALMVPEVMVIIVQRAKALKVKMPKSVMMTRLGPSCSQEVGEGCGPSFREFKV